VSAATDASFFDTCRSRLAEAAALRPEGVVRGLVGTVLEAEGLPVSLGSVCRVEPGFGPVAEVIGFREGRFLLMPYGDATGVGPGARVELAEAEPAAPRGEASLGRVIDALGRPLDGGPPLCTEDRVPLLRAPEPPLARPRIEHPLPLGVRALDALLVAGRGSRLGLFAGSGVGKSTLLGQIARFTSADVIVVALVGERGREVREFVERDLGEALARSVVVVATSDEAPLLRRRAAQAATAIAEDFRGQGRHVLLLMDSLTRFCTAQREIGLAAGEPPATRGYTPSVWSVLPRLLERAGTAAGCGSVTGIYTVLVEGDDLAEPVADAARALLDGHVVLSREIAEHGRHPAIDVLASVSRVMSDVVSPEQMALAQRTREVLATWRRAEDLIAIGAYVEGSDPAVDEARRLMPALRAFLCQARDERADWQAGLEALTALVGEAAPVGDRAPRGAAGS
jgi:flagellum-specific ATP synthase